MLGHFNWVLICKALICFEPLFVWQTFPGWTWVDHVNVVGFGAAMSFLDSCLAAHGIFPKVLQTYFDIPMLILLAFVPSLRNTCMYINGFAKLICKINKMSCFQTVALWIFVLVDRCRKGFRNVSGTFTVILKFCCNAPQFFLGSRLSIKVCAGTFFEALTDNGLLVKIFCSIWHVGGGQS